MTSFKFASLTVTLISAFTILSPALAQDKPSFSVDKLPKTWEKGQVGTNQCQQWGESDQESMCQNVFVNSVDDFCLWAPYKAGSIGEQEEKMVSWCTRSGYGTRLIPDGTLKGAHFVKTPSFVQVTGTGDFTSMMISADDEGGELDPHGATGAGNPPGGLFFTTALAKQGFKGSKRFQQIKEWNNYMSATEFSIRGCFGDQATQLCPHIYDTMGARFSSPGNYTEGIFEDCQGEDGAPPGVYGTSTFYQGQSSTPAAQDPGASSNCQAQPTVSNQLAAIIPKKSGKSRLSKISVSPTDSSKSETSMVQQVSMPIETSQFQSTTAQLQSTVMPLAQPPQGQQVQAQGSGGVAGIFGRNHARRAQKFGKADSI